MIVCDFCGDEEIVWTDNGMHLCEEHDKERRRGNYEHYKKTYGNNPDKHRAIRTIIPCELCGGLTICECQHCAQHCLKDLDKLKDKDLFLFKSREK